MPRPNVEAERRPQILSAACEVIATVGVPELRLADVAKVAGVSSGTVHYYFETKKDVINAAFAFNLEQSLERRQQLLNSAKGNLAILGDLVESYLPKDEVSRQAWKVWLALWAEASRDEHLQEVNERLYGQWRDVVAGIIEAAQRDGSARAGNPVQLANMLVGMLDGMAVQVLLGSRGLTLAAMRKICKAFIREMIAAP